MYGSGANLEKWCGFFERRSDWNETIWFLDFLFSFSFTIFEFYFSFFRWRRVKEQVDSWLLFFYLIDLFCAWLKLQKWPTTTHTVLRASIVSRWIVNLLKWPLSFYYWYKATDSSLLLRVSILLIIILTYRQKIGKLGHFVILDNQFCSGNFY